MEKFLKDWLSSWTGINGEFAIRYYHRDVQYIDPANPKGLHGAHALKVYLDKLISKHGSWKWELLNYRPISNTRYQINWRMTSPKISKVTLGSDILEFKDGVIIFNEVNFDPEILNKISTK